MGDQLCWCMFHPTARPREETEVSLGLNVYRNVRQFGGASVHRQGVHHPAVRDAREVSASDPQLRGHPKGHGKFTCCGRRPSRARLVWNLLTVERAQND